MVRGETTGVPAEEDGKSEPREGAWESALSVREFAAVGSAGFDPVGLVLGTAIFHVGYTGAFTCTYEQFSSRSLESTNTQWRPFSGLVDAMYAVRTTALRRAVSECRARGGDGVVGLTFRIREISAENVEFTAVGTAVRARSSIRPRRPFTSHLSGQEFARLVHSGWVPTGVAFGISMASRHDDRHTVRQSGWTAGNQEVDTYTQLVSQVRRDARAQLTREAAKNGGDALVVDDMELRVRERDCRIGAKDRVAEALFVGTSIARFERTRKPAGPAPLTIMRLDRNRNDLADEPSRKPAAGDGTPATTQMPEEVSTAT